MLKLYEAKKKPHVNVRKVGNCSVVNDLKFVTVFQKYGPCIKFLYFILMTKKKSLQVKQSSDALCPTSHVLKMTFDVFY